MAVDYTKVFTIVGKYADKVKDYYAYIATMDSDVSAIETVLAAQSAVYLGDGLTDMYDELRNDVSSWTDALIDRVSTVLTDEALIGANFSFGSEPTLGVVFPALIEDMNANDKNVTASVATVGARTYNTVHTDVGVLVIGTKLDGVSAPIDGGAPIRDYLGITTQLTPTSETITFTCTSDSETGAIEGSESFVITGTAAVSGPYSPTGENVGNLGSLTVADANAVQYLENPSFDEWDATSNEPTSWEVDAGTAVTDFEEATGASTIRGDGSALKIIGTTTCIFRQVLSSDVFDRGKAYFLSAWTKPSGTGDLTLTVRHHPGGTPTNIATETFALSVTTKWSNQTLQFVIPWEVEEDLELLVTLNPNASDDMLIDHLVITPCEYIAGVAMALFAGEEKFLIDDEIVFTLSNNNAGLFQSFFRKAYRIQLPTDAAPTISDSLVA